MSFCHKTTKRQKNYTILAPVGRKLHKWSVSETSSQATTGSDFTSKASWEFGEDVKKRLRLLSKERLSPREEKPGGFVRHFFGKKKKKKKWRSVLKTAPPQFPRDRVGLLTSKLSRIQSPVRIPRERVFNRPPAG